MWWNAGRVAVQRITFMYINAQQREQHIVDENFYSMYTFKAFKSKWILMCLYLTSLLLLFIFFFLSDYISAFLYILFACCFSLSGDMTHLQNCQRIHLYYRTVNVLFVFRCMCVSQLNCVFNTFHDTGRLSSYLHIMGLANDSRHATHPTVYIQGWWHYGRLKYYIKG